MEVLILGPTGVEELLGQTNVMALRKLVADRNDVTSFATCLLPLSPIQFPKEKEKSMFF
jgi:hypothetical protein